MNIIEKSTQYLSHNNNNPKKEEEKKEDLSQLLNKPNKDSKIIHICVNHSDNPEPC